MTGQQREFAVGDRVIRRYTAAKYGAGTVFEIVPYYRIEWDNGFEPAVYSPEELDPAPCPPLAVGDPFTAWMAGGLADDLPVGTAEVDTVEELDGYLKGRPRRAHRDGDGLMDEITYKPGDRVTHRHRGGGESTGRVLSVVYRVEWDDPHIPDSSCRGGDLRPRRRLAVDDTFGGDDGLSDELPAGTIVVDDCGNEADAWICRGRGKWMHTGGVSPIRLPPFLTYKIIHMPEVES